MKTKKRYSVLALLCVGLLLMATACGKTKEAKADAEVVLTPSDVAIERLEGCDLDDDEMLASIEDYYEFQNTITEEMGVTVAVTVEEDGEVLVTGTYPVLDEETEEETGETEEAVVFAWSSIAEGFAYLYECNLVDLAGNLLIE